MSFSVESSFNNGLFSYFGNITAVPANLLSNLYYFVKIFNFKIRLKVLLIFDKKFKTNEMSSDA